MQAYFWGVVAAALLVLAAKMVRRRQRRVFTGPGLGSTCPISAIYLKVQSRKKVKHLREASEMLQRGDLLPKSITF